jgi:hypothetical protein
MIFEGMVGKPLDLEDRHGKERHQGFEDSLLESLARHDVLQPGGDGKSDDGDQTVMRGTMP